MEPELQIAEHAQIDSLLSPAHAIGRNVGDGVFVAGDWSGPLGPDSDQAADLTVGRGLLANRRRTLVTLDEMARSGPWMLFSGIVATAAGLAILLGSGGALPFPFVSTPSGAELPSRPTG